MGAQNRNGLANEWATALAYSSLLEVPIEESPSSRESKSAFDSFASSEQNRFLEFAKAGAGHVLDLEKNQLLANPPTGVWMPSDSAGKNGDVRDVVVLSDKDHLFGVSCKNNHADFKHPRISARRDWVKVWGLNEVGCSDDYFDAVKPIFDAMAKVRRAQPGALFEDHFDRTKDIYIPAMAAFIDELNFQFDADTFETPQGLIRYVIGRRDFYKTIKRDSLNEVHIQAFNFDNTLSVKRSALPSKIIAVDQVEGSTYSVNVRLDRGYVFNFRIHTASSRVEASLKFAISAIGLPASEIYQHHIQL